MQCLNTMLFISLALGKPQMVTLPPHYEAIKTPVIYYCILLLPYECGMKFFMGGY
jgi:hypothetical protein